MEFALESYMPEPADVDELFSLNKISDGLLTVRRRVALEGMCRDDALALEHYCPGFFQGTNINKFTTVASNTGATVAIEAIDWKRGAIVLGIVGVALTLLVKFFSWLASLMTGKSVGGGSGPGITDIHASNSKIKEHIKPMTLEEAASAPQRNKITSFYNKYAQLANFSVNNMYLRKMERMAEESTYPKKVIPDDAAWAIQSYVRITNHIDPNNLALHALYGRIYLARNHGIRGALDLIDWVGSPLPPDQRINAGFINRINDLLGLSVIIIGDTRGLIRAIVAADENKAARAVDSHPGINLGPGEVLWDGRMGTELQYVWSGCQLLIKHTNDLGNRIIDNPDFAWLKVKAGAKLNRLHDAITDNMEIVVSDEWKKRFDALREEAQIVPTFHYRGDYSKIPKDKRRMMDINTKMFEALATEEGRISLATLHNKLHETKKGKAISVFRGAVQTLADSMKFTLAEFNDMKKHLETHKKPFVYEHIWRDTPDYKIMIGTNKKVPMGFVFSPMHSLEYSIKTLNSLQVVLREALAVVDIIANVAGAAVAEMEIAAEDMGELAIEAKKYED